MTGTGFTVRPGLRRSAHRDESAWLDSAVDLLGLLASRAGLDDLGGSRVLDMGCGTKLTKAIIERRVPIGRYVGIDTSREVIDLLEANVHDARFGFHHISAHNELYNPAGLPLSDLPPLPVGDERFDVVCLFSVFTHLAPHDYATMLRLLRPCAADGAHLVFSLFLNEDSGTGHGLMDRPRLDAAAEATLEAEVARQLASGDVEARERFAAALAEQLDPPDFVDLDPDQPLMYAVYSRRHALELVEGTGWEVQEVGDPTPTIQHHIVCRPVG